MIMDNINLNALRDRAYKTACEHGFHDKELSNEHLLCLIISELMEAVEADRKGKHANRESFKSSYEDEEPHDDVNFKYCFEKYIKDSYEDELSDTVIRCLDLVGLKQIYLPTLDSIDTPGWDEEDFKEPIPEFAYFLCQELLDECSPLDIRIYNVIEQIFVYCRFNCIDIEWFIEQKMRYNELRPMLNGKRY